MNDTDVSSFDAGVKLQVLSPSAHLPMYWRRHGSHPCRRRTRPRACGYGSTWLPPHRPRCRCAARGTPDWRAATGAVGGNFGLVLLHQMPCLNLCRVEAVVEPGAIPSAIRPSATLISSDGTPIIFVMTGGRECCVQRIFGGRTNRQLTRRRPKRKLNYIRRIDLVYPVHAIIRKFVGSMTRKLSVTSSQ